MKRFVFVLSLLLFVGFNLLQGQGVQVTGNVTSADDGTALPGVSVVVRGTTIGAVTDFEGNYAITVPDESATLMFSFVGMLTQEVALDGQTEVDVVLESTSLELDEVVVTALGVSREKKSLGYAVQEVDGDAVNQVKTDNLVSSLSGKVAGVQIKVANNFGGGNNIVIRGSSSLTQSNQALFVVDGIPVSNRIINKDQGQQLQGSTGYDYGNAVSDLNPNDIESISVLKGAAATALYGSRAANGVIIVTTKKGTRGTRLGVDINSNVTVGSIDRSTFPKHQKKYGPGYYYTWYSAEPGVVFDWDDIDGDGNINTETYLVPYYDDGSRGEPLDGKMVAHYDYWVPESPNYQQLRPYSPSENDAITFFDTPVSLTNSIDIHGGAEKMTYRMSYANKDQSGLYPNSKLKRNSFTFSGSYDVLKNLKVSTSANYVNTKTKNRNSTGYGGNLMANMRQWYQVQLDMDLQKYLYEETGRNVTWNRNWWNDPTPIYWDNYYWVMYENYPTDERNRLIGYVRADWEITDYLSIMGRVAADSYNELQEERLAVGSIAQRFGTGFPKLDQSSGYARYNRQFMETNVDLMARFKKDVGDMINISALLGTNIRRSKMESVYASTVGGLAVPGLYSLGNSVDPMLPPDERLDEIGVNGIFGSVSLGVANLVYIDGTLRRDQSSTLPTENNTYFYPSVSGSFLFGNLFDADWLQLGKLRVNYAEVGNDAPARRVLDTYDAFAPFAGNSMASVNPRKNNTDLLPEKMKSIEAGLEMNMFQNRIGFDVALYKTNTINQLMPVDVSFATGYRSTWVNAGEIENKGVEVALFATPAKTSNFSWNVSLNWAKNVNEVISLFVDEAGNAVQNLQLGSLQGNVSINARVGEPYGTIQGTNYVYHENGERLIDPSTGHYQKTAAANEVIGNVNPDWIGGITNTLNYKGFSLSFLIDWQQGSDVFSLDLWYGWGTGLYEETALDNDLGNPMRDRVADGGGIILDGVLPDGSVNDIRVESDLFGEGWITSPNARFVFDASYIKLREVVLTYNLPKSLMDRTPLYGASLSLVGSNLWIIHKNLPHADPEASQGAGNVQGWQSGVMPTTRNFGVSLNIQF